MAILEVTDLTVAYGGLRAVDSLSMRVERGQLVGLIGPNGAGKTTLLDAVTGFVPATGRVVFDGNDVSSLAAHRRARLGLARTWQAVQLFDDLSVAENLQVAAATSTTRSFLLDLVHPNRLENRTSAEDLLEQFDLRGLAERPASELSQGQRKLVGVARALAAKPQVVVMDEPAAGLDTSESEDLGRRLRGIVDQGIAIVLIDHDMRLVLTVCDYIYVMQFGALIAEGVPREIRQNDQVIAAYLGESSVEDIGEAKSVLAEIEIHQDPTEP